jgi:hypothetical protein
MSLSRKFRRKRELITKKKYSGRCPSCNAVVTLAATPEGDIALHPMPFCNHFFHSDADEYLHQVFPNLARN